MLPFPTGPMPMSLSSATSSEGKQSGSVFSIGDFSGGKQKLSKNAMILIGGLAFLAVFAYVAKK